MGKCIAMRNQSQYAFIRLVRYCAIKKIPKVNMQIQAYH